MKKKNEYSGVKGKMWLRTSPYKNSAQSPITVRTSSSFSELLIRNLEPVVRISEFFAIFWPQWPDKTIFTQKRPLRFMYNSNLSTKFLRLRKYLEYSQENIALEMDISPEAYGKIERGKTSISEKRLRQLSVIFGFEPWEMLQLDADELLILLINRRNAPPEK